MRYITFAILICIFFLLRPYQMQKLGLCYRGDDLSYFAHATALTYGQFPSYDKEYFDNGEQSPLHSIGPGLMAAPFVFVFSLIDRINGADIVRQRTADNVRHSWSMFGFVVASSVYFWLGCWFLYSTSVRFYPLRHTVLALILMVLVQGIPIYVFRRPIFSHAYEFFLQAFMVYLFFKPKAGELPSLRYWLTAGVTLALMPLVRYNNLVASGFWWLALSLKHEVFKYPSRHKKIIAAVLVFGLLILVFFILPSVINHNTGYHGKFRYFFRPWWLTEYPTRAGHVLFGAGWGLVYTAPFILAGLWSWLARPHPDKKYLWWCMLPMAVNFHLIVVSDGQGGYFGYRYFICSMIPLLVIPLAGWLKDLEERYSRKIYGLIGLIALFPFFSMLCFEGNDSGLTLDIIKLHKGYGFSNATYQWEIWKLLFTRPVEWGIAVFKGGLLYWIYVAAQLTGTQRLLPDIVLQKYPEFRPDILIKVLIIYALPLLLLYMTRLFKKTREES